MRAGNSFKGSPLWRRRSGREIAQDDRNLVGRRIGINAPNRQNCQKTTKKPTSTSRQSSSIRYSLTEITKPVAGRFLAPASGCPQSRVDRPGQKTTIFGTMFNPSIVFTEGFHQPVNAVGFAIANRVGLMVCPRVSSIPRAISPAVATSPLPEMTNVNAGCDSEVRCSLTGIDAFSSLSTSATTIGSADGGSASVLSAINSVPSLLDLTIARTILLLVLLVILLPVGAGG